MSDATKETRIKVHISSNQPEKVTADDVAEAVAEELEKLKSAQRVKPLFSSSEDILVITAEVGMPLSGSKDRD